MKTLLREKVLKDKNIGHWDWWVERRRGVNFLISFRRVSSVLNLFVNLKFVEYPCFYVVLAGSLHFPNEKYFCLYYLFVCCRINYYVYLKADWIKIAENMILLSVLYLIFWCHSFFNEHTAYSFSGMGRFDKILLCPHEDGQEQHLSATSIKFLWLRQIHDPSGIFPAVDNALSTLLSCCSQHFFPVRVLASFMHLLPVVTLSDNNGKQIAAATSFPMSAF